MCTRLHPSCRWSPGPLRCSITPANAWWLKVRHGLWAAIPSLICPANNLLHLLDFSALATCATFIFLLFFLGLSAGLVLMHARLWLLDCFFNRSLMLWFVLPTRLGFCMDLSLSLSFALVVVRDYARAETEGVARSDSRTKKLWWSESYLFLK